MENLHLRIDKAFNRLMNELDDTIDFFEKEVKTFEVYDKIAFLKYLKKQLQEVGINKLVWQYHEGDMYLVPVKTSTEKHDLVMEADIAHRELLIKKESDLMAILDKIPSYIKFWEDIYRQEINIANLELIVGEEPPEIPLLLNNENIIKAVKIIFNYLNKRLIHCDYENFERHFINNGSSFYKVRWTGGEPQIVLLWEAFKAAEFIDIKTDISTLINKHFINNKGKQFKVKQIRVVQNKTGFKNYKSPNLNFIDLILQELEAKLTFD